MTKTIALEDPQNLRRHARESTVERVGWVVVISMLLAAMLGMLGPGLLSNRTASSMDGDLTVKYSAIERYESPSELRIYFRTSAINAETVTLTLSRSFTDTTSPENITPEPDSVEMQADRLLYHFRISDRNREGRIVYRYQHHRFGHLSYTVGLLDGASVDISQFVMP